MLYKLLSILFILSAVRRQLSPRHCVHDAYQVLHQHPPPPTPPPPPPPHPPIFGPVQQRHLFNIGFGDIFFCYSTR